MLMVNIKDEEEREENDTATTTDEKDTVSSPYKVVF